MTEYRPAPPSMDEVVGYWHEIDPPWLKSWDIGWGEPFCFACGWLAPVPDKLKSTWRSASKWLDRAHLHDHCAGGSSEPSNIAAVCHICHHYAPDLDSTEDGVEWLKGRPPVDPYFQIWTDATLWGVEPTRSTTLFRAKAEFLELRQEVAREYAVVG